MLATPSSHRHDSGIIVLGVSRGDHAHGTRTPHAPVTEQALMQPVVPPHLNTQAYASCKYYTAFV
jgi:hypothetical protein